MSRGWWDPAGKCSMSLGAFGSVLVVPSPSPGCHWGCKRWADESWVRKMLGEEVLSGLKCGCWVLGGSQSCFFPGAVEQLLPLPQPGGGCGR